MNAVDDYHPVQEIMSRTGSFPLHTAITLIDEYAPKDGIVLDPFSGKGTTLLAARLLNRKAYGMDIAPEAVLCSKAKLQDVDLESLEEYLASLRLGYPSIETCPDALRIFFSDSTLRQILSLRNVLRRDTNSVSSEIRSMAIFTQAIVLGILHGHASYSLSIPSAHAYAMAPNYVRNFSKANGLKAPDRDVKKCILAKIKRCLSKPLPPPVQYSVLQESATDCSTSFASLCGKVDLILTSPPYLNAQTYAKDNWLRLWFLGYDYKKIQQNYIQTGSVSRYSEIMSGVFKQFSSLLHEEGVFICIAGTVSKARANGEKETKEDFDIGLLLADLITADPSLGLKVDSCIGHSISSRYRYYHSLNRTNGHHARDLKETTILARREAK